MCAACASWQVGHSARGGVRAEKRVVERWMRVGGGSEGNTDYPSALYHNSASCLFFICNRNASPDSLPASVFAAPRKCKFLEGSVWEDRHQWHCV